LIAENKIKKNNKDKNTVSKIGSIATSYFITENKINQLI
jgi:hypothetical protein